METQIIGRPGTQLLTGDAVYQELDRLGIKPMRGGSRDHDLVLLQARAAAALAGTVNGYIAVPTQPFRAMGFYWLYEAAEANVDNTLDWDISYSALNDGTIDTVVFTNVNPNGLLDTAAPLVLLVNRRNAASSGAAAAAASDPADVRIPAPTTIRFNIVTAGTGTIPAVQLGIYGAFL